ncbi:hypothetical protein LG201_13055 [Methylobacillus gramineus]|uniref:hypothetical protein n=1 Tax=Methylobacillus gramineus TaxID=755169 RepID=UPI001CFF64F2|nr:hypothetical protein [Methylobacillus gramineus]MCB5186136.1 hypothetical protein [Methylobacillus gramineus]
MQFKTKATVLGARHFNDVVDGTKHDFTKIHIVMPVSTNSGAEVGFNAQTVNFGTAAEFEKIKALPFPVEAELDLEMTTKGIVCHGFKNIGKAELKVAA